MLISFSGLDGAGKTTLIRELGQALEQRDEKVTVLRMYDDISFYSRLRVLRRWLRRGCAALTGRPPEERPPQERLWTSYVGDPRTDVSDQAHVLSRGLYRMARSLAVRRAVLVLDLICLVVRRFYVEAVSGSILILDRYLYDSLVDVMDVERPRWSFARFLTRFGPTPDAPVFVDVPAEEAFGRKPEFPLDYLRWRRGAYQQVFSWVHRPIVLDNRDLASAVAALTAAVGERMAAPGRPR